jgi:hypothetical protein
VDDHQATADTPHTDARPGAVRGDAPDVSYEVHPIGWIESPLLDTAEAPKQGELGAPDAWLVLNPTVREGARDLAVGSDIIVLTWLHQARRDVLVTHPGGVATRPERGVFSTSLRGSRNTATRPRTTHVPRGRHRPSGSPHLHDLRPAC